MINQDDSAPIRSLVLAVFETNGRLVETGNALVRPLG